jgi:hypothetical protein
VSANITPEAIFDDPAKRTYRYWLRRRWSSGSSVLFIMLNPSISDESRDSRTLGRCCKFAQMWGFGALEVCNLFAFVDQRNNLVHRTPDPVGPKNDEFIAETVQKVTDSFGIVVAAWGCDGERRGRDEEVVHLVTAHADLWRIGPATRGGHPRHPLYLRADLVPELHRRRRTDEHRHRRGWRAASLLRRRKRPLS